MLACPAKSRKRGERRMPSSSAFEILCAPWSSCFAGARKGIDFSIHLCTAADLIYALEYEGNERDKLVRYL